MTRFDPAAVSRIASGLRFPEGPVAVDDGTVLVTEIEGAALARVAADGSVARIPVGGGANGAAFGPDGAVYVCNDGGLAFAEQDGIRFPHALADGNDGGRVQRVDLATGSVETVFTHCAGERIGSLNDIVFDRDGGCYVVDTTNGCLYYADVVARTIQFADRTLQAPNGAGLSPDGSTLYVSETYTGDVMRYAVTGPGTLGPRTLHHANGGEHHWDGLAVDGAGNVCVANLQRSGVTVISPDGEPLDALLTPLPDPYVTNLCFGGPDGNTAYVCSSGRGLLYAVAWPWPGLRLNFAR